MLETKYANAWIRDLILEARLNEEHVFHLKVHGDRVQMKGIPDYLICFRGRFIAVEFKVADNEVSPLQRKNLEWIALAGGISLVIIFFPLRKLPTEDTPRQFLIKCIENNKGGTFEWTI